MIGSKKVFISESALVAFVDRVNPHHSQAAAFFRYFAENKYKVFTSYINIEEAYREIFEKISPVLARDFLRAINLSNINILYPTESDLKAALKILISFRSPELTLWEAQTAVLANRYSISQICTFKYLHPLYGLGVFNLPL